MGPHFRASMNWLHTWAGVVLGGLLFAMFWMGSLAVFDREIDRWMAPMTRLAERPVAFDSLRPWLDEAAAKGASDWSVALPTAREPTVRMTSRTGRKSTTVDIDPATGAVLADPGTWAGTYFILPFHYMLHVRLWRIGAWTGGLGALAMLALCISGVVFHRKLFAEFFTFRPRETPRRLLRDLHTCLGALGLPFHLAMALSALIIFIPTFQPAAWGPAYGGRQAFNAAAFDSFSRKKTGEPGGGLASLDAMAAEAGRLGGAAPRTLSIHHLGDLNAYVQIEHADPSRVARIADAAYFDAATGGLLHETAAPGPMAATQRFFVGLHMLPQGHLALRWLYFLAGLVGCGLMATGYLFWLESRRARHAQLGLSGVRVVGGLTVGATAGIVLATFAFFVANRLLPLEASFAGIERARLETCFFYAVWLAAFAHAWLRPKRAWAEQCGAGAAAATAAVLLNWITTGDHLVRSLGHRHLWPIAGMDLMLLAAAGLAAYAVHRLKPRPPR